MTVNYTSLIFKGERENEQNNSESDFLVGLGFLGGMIPRATADESDQKTIFTFSGPVEIPGPVLQAGTYVFKRADSQSDRDIVPVFNKDETHLGSTALTAGTLAVAAAQQIHSPDHHLPNESDSGRRNSELEAQNPDSVWSPPTDAGGVAPFKYSFALSRKRVESGGWTTVRELPISKDLAGVEMRLTAGGVRELHWHVEAEWAMMLYGNARITAVDQTGKSFVSDVSEGDLWLFPKGVPHSIQGLGPDGCRFLLVFDDGGFNEFEIFLITDWLAHTPPEVLAKNFNVPASTFGQVSKKELFIFQTDLPGDLKAEQAEAGAGAGTLGHRFDFSTRQMKPTKVTSGGEVKIVDANNFPITPIAAALVRLKPGGLRELHWHPNADEWQYYISGRGRMTVFEAGGRARTMDFQEGDVGYVLQSMPHYVENTGKSDLVFLEMFKSPHYEDISLAEWMAHTPHQLVDQHLHVGKDMLASIPKQEIVITPL